MSLDGKETIQLKDGETGRALSSTIGAGHLRRSTTRVPGRELLHRNWRGQAYLIRRQVTAWFLYGGMWLYCAIGAVVLGEPTTAHTPLSGHLSPVLAVVPMGCRITATCPSMPDERNPSTHQRHAGRDQMAIARLQARNRLLGSIPVSAKTHEPGLRTASSAPDADLFRRPGFVPRTSYSDTYMVVVHPADPGQGIHTRHLHDLRRWPGRTTPLDAYVSTSRIWRLYLGTTWGPHAVPRTEQTARRRTAPAHEKHALSRNAS
jgi:hypothetical protein